MPRVITWTARIVLVAVILIAIAGATDPDHDTKRLAIAPDEVEHAALSYCLTLLMIGSFPRTPPLLFPIGVMAVGGGLELIQYLGLLKGGFEITDWLADVVGALAAYLPLALGLRRRPEATPRTLPPSQVGLN